MNDHPEILFKDQSQTRFQWGTTRLCPAHFIMNLDTDVGGRFVLADDLKLLGDGNNVMRFQKILTGRNMGPELFIIKCCFWAHKKKQDREVQCRETLFTVDVLLNHKLINQWHD